MNELSFQEIEENLFYLDDVYFHTLLGPDKNFKNISQKGYKVTIDGQGADELFGGYAQSLYDYIIQTNTIIFFKRYFFYINTYKKLFHGSLEINTNFLYLLKQNLKYNFLKNKFFYYIFFIISKILKFDHIFIFNEFIFNNSKPLTDDTRNTYNKNKIKDYLDIYLLRKSLPNILRVVDRISMKNGVEVRMPFLDINLLNYSKIFNDKNLYKNQKTKSILKLF